MKLDKKKCTLILIIILHSCENEQSQKEVSVIAGCTDENADNYNSQASVDDGSCSYFGCTNPNAVNFDSSATIDDGNCIYQDEIPIGYQYFWNDEFNVDSLNQNYWNIELMNAGEINNEKQEYVKSSKNLYQENGNLVIKARKSTPFDPNNPSYTSSRVNTKNKVHMKYGYIEVRAKLPSGIGTWPAIFMLSEEIESVGWPFCGEIDIMEHVGYQENHIFFSIHNGFLNSNVHGTDQQGVFYSEGVEDEFHIYSMTWDSTKIEGYFDNQLYFTFNKPISATYNEWPYDSPYFLILNLAIGGDWGGQEGIDNSIFPATYMIDYVRIYSKILY